MRTAKLRTEEEDIDDEDEPRRPRGATEQESDEAARNHDLLRLLGDAYHPELTWVAWCGAAEGALAAAGAWRDPHAEQPKGAKPALKHGGARRGPGHPQDEREARKLVRRAHEARSQWGRRQEVKPDLWNALRSNASMMLQLDPPGEPSEQAVHDTVEEVGENGDSPEGPHALANGLYSEERRRARRPSRGARADECR